MPARRELPAREIAHRDDALELCVEVGSDGVARLARLAALSGERRGHRGHGRRGGGRRGGGDGRRGGWISCRWPSAARRDHLG